MNYDKSSKNLPNGEAKNDAATSFWNDHIMERFVKANLFIICCVAAGLLLIVYLGAFSCEVSWILEARGDLPYSAYILCTQYFVVFVATTILIHGLVTGLPFGLFAWSVVIGVLSIPELIFVMIMTTQHWGLQSIHGLTELVAYLLRLLINCFSLICVIPTGLKWRREAQVLMQLQDLAARLQLQTPPPSIPIVQDDSRRTSKRLESQQQYAFENVGFQVNETANNNNDVLRPQSQNLSLYGSQNEFNASMFTMPFIPLPPPSNDSNGINGNKAQSLMDLRCTLPGLYNPRYVLENSDEKNGKYFNITIDDLKNNLQDTHRPPSLPNDPIYCSIDAPQSSSPMQTNHLKERQRESLALPSHQHIQQRQIPKLSRNCISLENLEGITKVQNELQNYNQQQQYYLAMLGYLQHQQLQQEQQKMYSNNMGKIYRRPGSQDNSVDGVATSGNPMPGQQQQQEQQQLYRRNSQQLQYYGGFGYVNYTNPYVTANSKLSLGNESDDYRKYRDVAL